MSDILLIKSKKLSKEEESEMEIIMSVEMRYSVTDGCAPKLDDGTTLLILGAPMPMEIKPGEKISVDLGISFDDPILLVEHPGAAFQGLRLANKNQVILPGKSVIVNIESLNPEGGLDALIERGTTLAAAIALVGYVDLVKV